MASIRLPEDLFQTNRTPTVEEVTILRNENTAYEIRLGQINQRLHSLVKNRNDQTPVIENLIQEKNAIIAAHLPVKQALSPMRRLPQDVIREIFSACTAFDIHDRIRTPTFLSSICTGMRQIALEIPELWAVAWVDIKPKSAMAVESQTVALREWLLERSRNCPLVIHITEHFGISNEDANRYQDIVDVILSCRSRWRKVFICTSSAHLHSRLRQLSPLDVPLLNMFTLNYLVHPIFITVDPVDDTNVTQFGFLAGANVKRFGIVTYANIQPFSVIDLPITWKNMTHLLFENTGIEDDRLIPILIACSSLICLAIAAAKYSQVSIPDIQLPSLKILHAFEYRLSQATKLGILSSIIAPNLDTVIYNTDVLDSNYTSIKMLLDRSSRICKVTIHKDIPDDVLIKCYRNGAKVNRAPYGQPLYAGPFSTS